MTFRYECTRLLVSHFKECFRFDRDVMGFQPTFGSEEGSYADFAVSAVHISLFDRDEMSAALGTAHKPAEADAQDATCLIFAVDDVDRICQELEAKGIRLATEPTDHADGGIRTAHFRDPDGHLIEINQPLKP